MTQNKTRIIFRADGNSTIGLGHVMRSLALAEMLRHDFECVFAIQAPDESLQEEIRKVCHGLIVLPTCLPEAERYTHELRAYVSSEEIVVLDGYHFNTAYQQRLKETGCTLICIDDIHAYPFVADVVINHAGGVLANEYEVAPYTELLLGPKYALLRSPFLTSAKIERELPSDKRRVLVNFGGADPDNHTLQVAKDLACLERVDNVDIVAGNAYRHLGDLQEWLEQYPSCRLHQNLSAAAMCELMLSCSVAITSASGVAYEYASVGGLLFISKTAENQAAIYRFLTANKIAMPYEEPEQITQSFTTENFTQCVAAQRLYFDGQSDKRLLQVFKSFTR